MDFNGRKRQVIQSSLLDFAHGSGEGKARGGLDFAHGSGEGKGRGGLDFAHGLGEGKARGGRVSLLRELFSSTLPLLQGLKEEQTPRPCTFPSFFKQRS